MIATETVIGTLTTQDLKALRQADTICLDHNADGSGTIRCIKEVRNPGPFEERDKTYRIACASTVNVYKDDMSSRDRGYLGYAYIGGTSCADNEFYTLSHHVLRAGDVVSLRWVGSDNNQYLSGCDGANGRPSLPNTGLHHDRVYLIVKRGEKTLRFQVDDSICPDNSARMIRRK